MAKGYIYRKPIRRSQYSNYRRYMIMAVIFVALFAGVGYFIYSGLHSAQKPSPLSAVEKTEITGGQTTFSNDYFEFQDTGSWVIDKGDTTNDKLVYHKFNKNVILAEMIVYINQDPIPLYSAVPRVLPVRIVNDNGFQATTISAPCGSTYAKGAPHHVEIVTINNAKMLCDPDSPQYFVILSEIEGDYHLHLKRSNGSPIEFVITYKDLGLTPQPDSITTIASTFHTK